MKAAATSSTILLAVLLSSSMTTSKGFDALKRQSPPSADDSKQAAVSEFVGCYELKLGRWWPWSSDDIRTFHTPPSRVELLSSRGTDGFVKDHFLIGPLPKPSRYGYWDLKSKNRIRLTWTDGLVGVGLNLAKHGTELSGWAHPHSDAPQFVPHIAHVIARKTSCPSSTADPTSSH